SRPAFARADPLRRTQSDGFYNKLLALLLRRILLAVIPGLRCRSRRLGDSGDICRIIVGGIRDIVNTQRKRLSSVVQNAAADILAGIEPVHRASAGRLEI